MRFALAVLVVVVLADPAAAEIAHCQRTETWKTSVTLMVEVSDDGPGRSALARVCGRLDAVRRCYDTTPAPVTVPKQINQRRDHPVDPQPGPPPETFDRNGELLLHVKGGRVEWASSTLRAREQTCVGRALAGLAMPATAAGAYRIEVALDAAADPVWSGTADAPSGTAQCDHGETWRASGALGVDVPADPAGGKLLLARVCSRLDAFRACASGVPRTDQPVSAQLDLVLHAGASGGVARVEQAGSQLAPAVTSCVLAVARGIALPKPPAGGRRTPLSVMLTGTTAPDGYVMDPPQPGP